jgi:CHAD domain-containing protein
VVWFALCGLRKQGRLATPSMPHVTPPTEPSTALLRAQVRALFRRVPRGLAGDEESIHQIRVTGRRLRVALPLLAARPGAKRVARAVRVLRQMTRAAGQSRDLDVIAGLFAERAPLRPEASKELHLLARRLRQARTRSRHRMAEALLDLDIAGLRRSLRAVLRRGGENVFTCRARLRQQRDEEGARLLSQVAAVGELFDPEALHALRRRARRLRYAAEVGAALVQREAQEAAPFRELQDRLGLVHDAFVLAQWLGGQAERSAARGQRSLAAAALAQRQAFLEEARRLHREVLALGLPDFVGRALAGLPGDRPAA